jgi:hypothetical protein
LKYTLYWLDGKREVIEGSGISAAVTHAGYGNGAIQALDFFTEGDNHDYVWNFVTRTWDKIEK